MDSLTKTLLQVSLGGSTWVLWLLLGLSLASVAVMVERAWVFFRHRFEEADFLSRLEPLLRMRKWQEALNLCQASPALEPKVLLAGLRQVGQGRDAVQEAMEGARLRLSLLLEKRLAFLGT
ncbi:MAG: MotA/TolQ/ExbB proton channel family protein, partial [Deltaproteobacteria bacterium]|nr:MotA/TolQ/ExbB proton channel family protein [Deltaproteobacteria bacterium]